MELAKYSDIQGWLWKCSVFIFLLSFVSSSPAVAANHCCTLVSSLMLSLVQFAVAQSAICWTNRSHSTQVGTNRLWYWSIDLPLSVYISIYSLPICSMKNSHPIYGLFADNNERNIDATMFPQSKNKKCLTSILWSPAVLARMHPKNGTTLDFDECQLLILEWAGSSALFPTC